MKLAWFWHDLGIIFKASPLPPAPLHAGSFKSVRSSTVSCTYWTFHTRYRMSCCFAPCKESAVCFFSCVYVCCGWEGKSANGSSVTRILYKHIRFFLFISVLVLVAKRWSYACPPKIFFFWCLESVPTILLFWCSWHGCYGWSFLAVGVGFSGPSSTCWFGLRTAELVARWQVVWCSE